MTKLTMLDLDLATSMIADLDDHDGQMYPPSRVAQQFRYALAELRRAHERVAELEAGLLAAWRAPTDDQRLELIDLCCRGCGSLNTSCQCWNDD